MIEGAFAGGCQCGAVRWRATAREDDAHLCHCRMCQKAVGGYFAALVGVPNGRLEWTRGAPATFRSSDPVERGFCRDCGTPLFYRPVGGTHTALTLGSLDDPAAVPPRSQHGHEGRLPFMDGLASLPGLGRTTEAGMGDAALRIAATSRQHPDRDTADWPSP